MTSGNADRMQRRYASLVACMTAACSAPQRAAFRPSDPTFVPAEGEKPQVYSRANIARLSDVQLDRVVTRRERCEAELSHKDRATSVWPRRYRHTHRQWLSCPPEQPSLGAIGCAGNERPLELQTLDAVELQFGRERPVGAGSFSVEDRKSVV